MLVELAIRNYALVDSLALSFDKGFTILTGETGAGKSIIVGALSFILGGKAGADCIRTGADEASVSAVVSISPDNNEARAWLSERGIPLEDGKLFARRVIKSSGRGSMYLQNIPQSQRDLAECMALLFDLHGQHQHESLMRADTHRRCLDRFAGIEGEVNDYSAVWTQLAEKKKLLLSSERSEAEREERISYLKYAVDEINAARLSPGEMRNLAVESAKLAGYEKLSRHIEQGADVFCEDAASVLNMARKARQALDAACAIDGALSETAKRISDLYYEAEDIAASLRSYSRALSFDPDRMETVENRIALLQRLKKKYAKSAAGEDEEAKTEEKILEWAAQAETEIAGLLGFEEKRETLEAKIKSLEKEVVSRAASITQKRRKEAAVLSEKITAVLQSLGMAGSRFAVSLEAKGEERRVYGQWGADDVIFLISANKGEPLKELARVASGGELSRVMLAIKSVLSGGSAADSAKNTSDTKTVSDTVGGTKSADNIETLVFDEIDTGIGGEVAVAVARYLAALSEKRQLFCITHLANIASKANNHFKVEKETIGERTLTTVRSLSVEERKQEIARMLSGGEGESALKHAGELLGLS